MPNIATVMKQEIARLARKEIKRETEALRRASAQYRREIAGLKRELQTARKKISVLESLRNGAAPGRGKGAPAQAEAADTKGRRFSPKWLKAHRRKLGLSAADYGKLIGVTGKTVYTWELGHAHPRGGAFRRWVAIKALGKREALARLEEE